jgi:hypothetical protein
VNPPCVVGEARMSGGGYYFSSPAVDWEGVCVRGVCAICLDGDYRCTDSSHAGIPQICLGGRWRALRGNGMQTTDLGGEQLAYNIVGQAQVAATAFAGLCFGLLVMLVALVYRGQQQGEARVRPLVSISNSMSE